ncbi:MAG: hypothetical protein QOJ98_2187, partial [Acidobacteriota bacterium]|nr:hypothetical protein [Acidobacteriota bacterium]
MSNPVEYTFNASALGVGGFYDRDGRRFTIPSLASVALAPTGGEGTATVQDHNQHGIA